MNLIDLKEAKLERIEGEIKALQKKIQTNLTDFFYMNKKGKICCKLCGKNTRATHWMSISVLAHLEEHQ